MQQHRDGGMISLVESGRFRLFQIAWIYLNVLIFLLWSGCVWALWGCAMQSGANNIATLLIGRIVAGVAIGYGHLSLSVSEAKSIPLAVYR